MAEIEHIIAHQFPGFSPTKENARGDNGSKLDTHFMCLMPDGTNETKSKHRAATTGKSFKTCCTRQKNKLFLHLAIMMQLTASVMQVF